MALAVQLPELQWRREVTLRDALVAVALLVLGAALSLAGFGWRGCRHEPRVGRLHPVIAVVGENARLTELTDFVISYGILSQLPRRRCVCGRDRCGLHFDATGAHDPA